MNLEDSRYRVRLYLAAALFCLVTAFVLLGLRSLGRDAPLHFPNLNGLGYYMYLPSVVIDGDLDIRNQAEIALGREAPAWLISGRYPSGVAISLAPTFLAAHAVSSALHALTGSAFFAPNGFSVLYPVLNLAGILAIWTLSMTLMDRMLRERFELAGWVALSAIGLFWLGSFALWYVVRSPFWAHVLSTAWLIIALSLVDRVLRDAEAGEVTTRLPLLGLVMSLAVLCRLTDVFMAPFAIYLAALFVRNGLLRPALRQAPLIALALSPLLLQYWIWHEPAGNPLSPQAIGYGPQERFHWAQPVLFLPLFSSLQGLFFYSPVLLWSLWGLVWGVWRRDAWRDPLVCCLLCSAGLLWYINGSWYSWWFGADAFGARAFLELGGLWILGFAFAVEHLRDRRLRARAAILSAVAVTLLAGYGLMFARAIDLMPSTTSDFLFQWERERFGHTLSRTSDPTSF